MRRLISVFVFTFFLVTFLSAQQNNGVIKGRVFNSKNNEGVPFATVQVWGTSTGAITDADGNFNLSGIKP
jgi:hypothetical protein